MVLMGKQRHATETLCRIAEKFRHPGNKIGCIVMNANPFTNGHRYLIQRAAAPMRLVASVFSQEDSSRFPYEDRLDLVLKAPPIFHA